MTTYNDIDIDEHVGPIRRYLLSADMRPEYYVIALYPEMSAIFAPPSDCHEPLRVVKLVYALTSRIKQLDGEYKYVYEYSGARYDE